MVHISSKNIDEIKNIHIHDAYFDGFEYDYANREIRLTCENDFYKITLHLVFHNVILFEAQSCLYWGNGIRIMYIATAEDSELYERYQKLQNEDKEKITLSALDQGVEFIPIEMLINSGDMFYFVCESIDYTEEPLVRDDEEIELTVADLE